MCGQHRFSAVCEQVLNGGFGAFLEPLPAYNTAYLLCCIQCTGKYELAAGIFLFLVAGLYRIQDSARQAGNDYNQGDVHRNVNVNILNLGQHF